MALVWMVCPVVFIIYVQIWHYFRMVFICSISCREFCFVRVIVECSIFFFFLIFAIFYYLFFICSVVKTILCYLYFAFKWYWPANVLESIFAYSTYMFSSEDILFMICDDEMYSYSFNKCRIKYIELQKAENPMNKSRKAESGIDPL